MNLNEFAKEVHENAVAHGWWEGEPDIFEKLALIHSEWSEALEAYRNSEDLVWHGEDGKPDGIAVELIDGCLRILDYLAWKVENGDTDMQELMNDFDVDVNNIIRSKTTPSVSTLIVILHYATSAMCDNDEFHPEEWFKILGIVCSWLNNTGLDPEALLLEKHAYNKSRPYRHGGKKC